MNVLGESNPLGLGIWAWFLGLKSDASKMLRFYKALSATKRTLVISPLEGKIKGIHNIRMPFIRF